MKTASRHESLSTILASHMYITVVAYSHLIKFFWIEELTLLPTKDDAFSAFVSVKVYVLGNLIVLAANLHELININFSFKTFVTNRIAIIHKLTDVSQWHLIDGILNPADLASLGFMPSDTQTIKKTLS